MIDFFNVEFTKEMFDNNLNINECILLSCINNKIVMIDKDDIQNKLPMAKNIDKTLRKFRRKGLIRRYSQDEVVDKLKNKSFNFFTCEWCKDEVGIIHEHHFPVQKKDGGNETVKICPNCHCTFHKFII